LERSNDACRSTEINMESQNYLRIMIDSLQKKKEILQRVVSYNEEQQRILESDTFNGDLFEYNMQKKSECIDELNSLDEGFQSVYDRIKADVEQYKQRYKGDIKEMQELIKEVTALSATIQAQEARNKVEVEFKFRQLREDAKTAKRSVSMANKYYQNMSKISSEPQFMDKKK